MKDLELAKMVIKLGNSSGEDGELLARAVISLHAALLEAREGLRQLDDFRVCNSPGRAIATNIIARIDKVLGEK